MAATPRVRAWCFTENNPTERFSYNSDRMSYLIYQLETGESGTPHYQGYIVTKKKITLGGLKKINARASFRVANGTAEQNKVYCTKEKGRLDGPWEYGEPPMPGQRNDLLTIANELRKRPLADVFNDHPEEAIRYGKGMKYFRSVVLSEERGTEYRIPEILVYWGDSGVGKSRRARLMDPLLYNVPVHEGGTTWFDGYDGQETILFDDFCGGMKYSQMLRFCDVYPLQVQTKGGFVSLNHRRIIITSNKPPEQWYSGEVQGSAEALLRRLYEYGNIIHFTRFEDEIIDMEYSRRSVPIPVLIN